MAGKEWIGVVVSRDIAEVTPRILDEEVRELDVRTLVCCGNDVELLECGKDTEGCTMLLHA